MTAHDMTAHDTDTRFALPGLDDPASTETGIILMGLDVGHLLAGLGLASLAGDAAAVALFVERIRHSGAVELTPDGLAAAGASHWEAVRSRLAEAGYAAPAGAWPRHDWERAFRIIGGDGLGVTGPAVAVYLTACWLRSEEIHQYLEETGQRTGR
jgi:hypothetical protein